MHQYVKADAKLKTLAAVIDRYPLLWIPQRATWIARLKTMHVQIPAKWDSWFKDVLRKLKDKISEAPEPETTKRKGPSYNGDQIGVLHGLIDDGTDQSFRDWFVANDVGPFTLRHILTIYQPKLDELLELKKIRDRKKYNGDWEYQLLEGYRYLKNDELLAKIKIYREMFVDIESLLDNRRRMRKPRKAKKLNLEKVAKRIRYLEIEPETKTTSLNPTAVYGKEELWAYDAQKRFLKVYRAKTGEKLSFNRTAIENVDTERSFQKKVRKPELVIPKLLEGGKYDLNKVFKGIRAKESSLPTFRTSDQLVFLRVF
jgi:hypothetical protein